MRLTNNAPPFRRRIILMADATSARGEVMDNVHHFIVTLAHNGSEITAAQGEALRFPWTTCPGAVGALDALIGYPVGRGAKANVDQSLQCTHMFDTAKLAIAQIARGGRRVYDITVRSAEESRICHAAVARDGVPLFEWRVEGGVVRAPDLFAGHEVAGRASWHSEVADDADLREAALALRRSLFVFRSRPASRPLYRAGSLPALRNVCFSFQSVRVADAVRPPGFVEYDPWEPDSDD